MPDAASTYGVLSISLGHHHGLPYGPKIVRDYVAPRRGRVPGTRGINPLPLPVSSPINLWAEQPKKSAFLPRSEFPMTKVDHEPGQRILETLSRAVGSWVRAGDERALTRWLDRELDAEGVP